MKKSQNPLYEGRSPSTGVRSTPDRFFYSPGSHYSEASTVRNRKTSKNSLAMAAKAVAGLFVACFTPPETNSSKDFVNSNEFKPSPGMTPSRSSSSSFFHYLISWSWLAIYICNTWHVCLVLGSLYRHRHWLLFN